MAPWDPAGSMGTGYCLFSGSFGESMAVSRKGLGLARTLTMGMGVRLDLE